MKEYIVNLVDISEYGRRMIIGNGIPKEELIRCKDCKYRDEQTTNCTRFRKDWYVQSNSFCSWAERKEE